MYPALEVFTEAVRKVCGEIRTEGGEYVAICPTCGNDNLKFSEGQNGVKCSCFSGGCDFPKICEALELPVAQTFFDYDASGFANGTGKANGRVSVAGKTKTKSKKNNRKSPPETVVDGEVRFKLPPPRTGDMSPAKHDSLSKCASACKWGLEQSDDVKEVTGWSVSEYAYPDGSPCFAVVRLEYLDADGKPDKQFRQCTLTAEGWQSGGFPHLRPLFLLHDVLGVTPQLAEGFPAAITKIHRSTPIYNSNVVVICEGEKAALALRQFGILTVSPSQGAQSPELTDWAPLDGLLCIILPDHDSSGGDFAKCVLRLLREQAKNATVEIKHLADTEGFDAKEKDDAHDWVEHLRKDETGMPAKPDGRQAIGEEMMKLVHALPDRCDDYQKLVDEEEVKEAKQAETEEPEAVVLSRGDSLANHETEIVKEDGKDAVMTTPLPLQEIKENLHAATGGWPKVTKGRLFVHEGDETVRYLDSTHQLFAWIGSHMNAPPHFKRDSHLHTKEEFFQYLIFESEEFERVETFPEFPQCSGVYYAHRELEPGDGTHLEKMLDYFLPATEVDRILIKAMICTLVSGIEHGQRPLFVISSPDRNAGKTSLAQNVSLLVGGFLKWSVKQDFDKFGARLLSSEGRAKRVVLIDNVKSGRFSHDELESIITLETISGRQNNVGESSRPNNLSWILTVNGPSMSRDIATRAIPIEIRMPKRRDDYTEDIRSFIREHLWDILEDCIAELQKPVQDVSGSTRFDSWDRGVLKRLNGTTNEVFRLVSTRQEAMDVDSTESVDIQEYFAEKLEELNYDAATDVILIPNDVAVKWYIKATGKHTGSSKMQRDLGRMAEAGLVTKMYVGSRTKSARGIGWNGDTSFQHCDVEDRILSRDGDDFRKRRGF